ncbi:SulP family inorganic anion transporter [Lacrimispora sp. 38-1]|uniref:SulP family inorganic anion transporter n=1 Tax=Lacrimispora sp. 38-1 TaxID=3125778 RepID=UPI003CF66377
MNRIKNEWFGNVKNEVMSGLVVAIALIPEAIGFSLLAGLNPMVGLYASFCIAIVTAIAGGRPGMISGATGAMALVLAGLVKSHGIEYMLAASVLAGLLQIVFGMLKAGNLLRFIPSPVMTGFVNALGILIFKAQLEHFEGANITMYVLVVVGMATIYFFPKVNKAIPAPLVAIVTLTVLTVVTKMDVTRIGDMGNIAGTLPSFLIPQIAISMETLKVIFPVALSLSVVGLVESMLTAQLLDEKTDTKSNKNRECIGQGLANVVAGLFGGMAGCAMIGQSVINFKSGGRKRLSTLLSGVFLMTLIVALNKWVIQIPIAALVAVMIIVSIATFDWHSIKRMAKVPKTDTIVMLTTVIIVLLTDNLAYGVITGIMMSSIFFVYKISQTQVEKEETEEGIIYRCYGQLFFASTTHFMGKFDFDISNQTIGLDVTHLKFWDESAGDAFDKIVMKYSERHVKLKIEGLSEACEKLLEKTSVQYSIMPEFVD